MVVNSFGRSFPKARYKICYPVRFYRLRLSQLIVTHLLLFFFKRYVSEDRTIGALFTGAILKGNLSLRDKANLRDEASVSPGWS